MQAGSVCVCSYQILCWEGVERHEHLILQQSITCQISVWEQPSRKLSFICAFRPRYALFARPSEARMSVSPPSREKVLAKRYLHVSTKCSCSSLAAVFAARTSNRRLHQRKSNISKSNPRLLIPAPIRSLRDQGDAATRIMGVKCSERERLGDCRFKVLGY